jgi:hypothetical protein
MAQQPKRLRLVINIEVRGEAGERHFLDAINEVCMNAATEVQDPTPEDNPYSYEIEVENVCR